MLGPYCNMEVTKGCSTKMNEYQVILNKYDIINIVEPLPSETIFHAGM